MIKTVFVCTGNTCRSPMAQGLFRQFLEERKINSIEVSSVGLSCVNGLPAAQNAVSVMSERGIDISDHKTKIYDVNEFDESTVFVCMTAEHKLILKSINNNADVIALNIPDPYMCGAEVYRQTADMILGSFEEILRYICRKIRVSVFAKSDVPYLAQLEKENFSLPWSEKSLEEELENPNARFFTAQLEGEAIGYIGAFNICGEVSVTNVVVKEGFRNLGIGTLLLKHLEDISVFEDAEFITLEVRQSNEKAMKLYSDNGYKQVGIRKGFYEKPKEDAVLMTKFLKE